MAHTWNPSARDAEARGLRVQGQPGLKSHLYTRVCIYDQKVVRGDSNVQKLQYPRRIGGLKCVAIGNGTAVLEARPRALTNTLPTGSTSSTVDFILQFYHDKQTNKPKTNNAKRNTSKGSLMPTKLVSLQCSG